MQKDNLKHETPTAANNVLCGSSEQFICLCPRNKADDCDRKEPCKECETCPHLRQINCT
jgi:hypothetical protein